MLHEKIISVINGTGIKAFSTISEYHAYVKLLFQALHGAFFQSKALRSSFMAQVSRQILFTGVEALGLVSIIAFICGVTIVLQSMKAMPQIGATEYFGNILVIAVVRELGPFFTSLVVIGRSGAALAAYIGTMRINKEIDALEIMGIDPVHFVVVPALAAMSLSMLCLNCYFDVVAIIGGLTIANVFVQIPFGIFLGKVIDALTWVDVLISCSKGLLFGVVIAIVSCRSGLMVKSIRAVPQAAMKAVVGSMTITIIVNILVTAGFYAW